MTKRPFKPKRSFDAVSLIDDFIPNPELFKNALHALEVSFPRLGAVFDVVTEMGIESTFNSFDARKFVLKLVVRTFVFAHELKHGGDDSHVMREVFLGAFLLAQLRGRMISSAHYNHAQRLRIFGHFIRPM